MKYDSPFSYIPQFCHKTISHKSFFNGQSNRVKIRALDSSALKIKKKCCSHVFTLGLWTFRESFFQRSWTFGLGQTSRAKIWGIVGQTISTHFGTMSSLSMFSIGQPLFLNKNKPWYALPKFSFGKGIWIWATKRFSLRVSVVRVFTYVIFFWFFFSWIRSMLTAKVHKGSIL